MRDGLTDKEILRILDLDKDGVEQKYIAQRSGYHHNKYHI